MWYPRGDREPTDVDDEAGVGLMTDKSESAARRLIEPRQSWNSKFSLSVALILTNIAWAGLCLSLFRGLHLPRTPPHMSQQGFEAHFGTSTSTN